MSFGELSVRGTALWGNVRHRTVLEPFNSDGNMLLFGMRRHWLVIKELEISLFWLKSVTCLLWKIGALHGAFFSRLLAGFINFQTLKDWKYCRKAKQFFYENYGRNEIFYIAIHPGRISIVTINRFIGNKVRRMIFVIVSIKTESSSLSSRLLSEDSQSNRLMGFFIWSEFALDKCHTVLS